MESPMPFDRISDLIGMIYDCTLDVGRYTATLEAVRTETNFCNAALQIWTDRYRNPFSIQSGISGKWMDTWANYGDDIVALWGGAERAAQYPLEEPILNSQAVDAQVRLANRYYREWVQPQGIVDAVAINYAREPGMVGTLAFGRHESAGDVTEAELGILRVLAPHFRRAASIGRLLDLRTLQAATFASALDALTTATVFLDRQLGVVYCNGAGERFLADRTVVALRPDGMTLRDPAAQEQLATAVAVATQNEARLGRRGIGIPVRRPHGEPLVIHLLPLTGGTARPGLVTTAVAALFIAPSPRKAALPSDAIAALYDLTPAEARVAELLAEAMPLTAIGGTLGIAVSTVKTHLARVFEKTGCSRQVELVNLLQSFRQSV